MPGPKEGHVVVFITGIRRFPSVSETGEEKDEDYFNLSREKFFLAFPVFDNTSWFAFRHSIHTHVGATA